MVEQCVRAVYLYVESCVPVAVCVHIFICMWAHVAEATGEAGND